MQRIALLLLLAAFAGAFAVGCHRRRPRDGTCSAHIDCNPGYDCVGRRCARRAGVPGLTPAAPVREPPPPAQVPETPPPPGEAPSGEVPETPRPPRERPRPTPEPPAPIDNAPTPPPPDLPAWKARLKNS